MTHRGVILATVAVLATGWLQAAEPDFSEKGALVRVITRWNSDCVATNISAWDDMVRPWYTDITNDDPRPDGHAGKAWWRDGFYWNGNIVDSDFTDPDVVAWGNDDADDRMDEPDAALVAMHGSEDPNDLRWRAKVRVDEPGDGNCRAYQGHMRFGDTDLEFLHLSSCHSMDQDQWGRWNVSFQRVHQVDGFHGVMYISDGWGDLYRDFSDDAFDDPISEAWMDNLYDEAFWPWEDDQCPVARGAGSTENDAWSRTDHEEYDNVFSDPASTYAALVFIGGCDPFDDPALPH
jgi:hypothetical protein